jgi:hypothetical protein
MIADQNAGDDHGTGAGDPEQHPTLQVADASASEMISSTL